VSQAIRTQAPEFAQASYQAQVRRLRRIAELALSRYAVRGARLNFVCHGENTTFRVEGSRGVRFLLRVHRSGYHSSDGHLEELRWLTALHNKGIEAPVPVRSRAGALLETVRDPVTNLERHCSLLCWIDGRFVGIRTGVSHYTQLGDYVGRLHRASKTQRFNERRYWDAEGLLGRTATLGHVSRVPGASPIQMTALLRANRRCLARLRRYQRSFPERLGAIHGDLHQWNFLVTRQGIAAIDFDDCGFGFRAYDLAVPLVTFGLLKKPVPGPVKRALRDAMVESYRCHMPWDEHDDALLDDLVLTRDLAMLGWLASRSDHPSLRARIPGALRRIVAMLDAGETHPALQY
jgi:Ser/Thr protein kinase RdoA (MazF antagonist)